MVKIRGQTSRAHRELDKPDLKFQMRMLNYINTQLFPTFIELRKMGYNRDELLF